MSDVARKALEFAASHLSSDWPARCQETVRRARSALHAMRVTQCMDTDSPWLICKPCADAGRCAKELQSISDEQIVELLREIDRVARDHDHYEYGLPLGFDGVLSGKSPQAAMVAVVREALTARPSSVPDRLRVAAQAVVDRWRTPLWKDAPATATFINALESALAATTPQEKTP